MHPGRQPRGESQRTSTHFCPTEATPAQSGGHPGRAGGFAGAWSDGSLSAVAAGFLAVLVSFAGPLATFYIFYQAAQVAHMPNAMFASWVWAMSIGAGVAGIGLSRYLRAPVITAWSAPGTALLITLFRQLPLGEAAGAYLSAARILLLIGLSGSLERTMAHLPKDIASGMMARILVPFGMNAFKTVGPLPLPASVPHSGAASSGWRHVASRMVRLGAGAATHHNNDSITT